MSASGEPKHGDLYMDDDGYLRIVFSTVEGVYQHVLVSPKKGLSWLDHTTRVKSGVPKESVYKFNIIDIINIILNEERHEHSD